MKKHIKYRKKSYIKFFGLIFILVLLFGNIGIWWKVYLKSSSNNAPNSEIDKNKILQADNSYGELIITKDDPSTGSAEAKIIIVVFSDFLCPYCAAYSGQSKKTAALMIKQNPKWQAALPAILRDYVDKGKVRLVWKDLPYHGDEAVTAHTAARCAFEQNKFWEYHDLLFAQHDSSFLQPFSKAVLEQLAGKIGIDATFFNQCLESGKYNKGIQEAVDSALKLNINKTPSTFINGVLLTGAVSFITVQNVIDEQLSRIDNP